MPAVFHLHMASKAASSASSAASPSAAAKPKAKSGSAQKRQRIDGYYVRGKDVDSGQRNLEDVRVEVNAFMLETPSSAYKFVDQIRKKTDDFHDFHEGNHGGWAQVLAGIAPVLNALTRGCSSRFLVPACRSERRPDFVMRY